MKKLFNRVLRAARLAPRAPKTPAPRPGASIGTAYRSFDTQAQIAAYADARFDRLKWAESAVNDPWVTEPGLQRAPAGYLDLTSAPQVTGHAVLETVRPPRFERRSPARLRADQV